jgi:hydrophobe/amphiphile efflux-1 (HAE1) family protein
VVDFFIDRPILSSVLSIVIVLAGTIALIGLPIAQFPEITPPQIEVRATYPGASADIVEGTVATPIEQEVNGVEDMIYMSSQSSNDGSMVLTVTFQVGTDLDRAAVNIQNRVAIAQSKLPEEVVRGGITTKKKSSSLLMVVALRAKGGSYDEIFLSNYASINVLDQLKRTPGVGDATIFGARDYGMRIWLNPDRLTNLGLTVTDVSGAIREQNVQFPAGQVGQPPAPPGQEFQYSVKAKGRLSEVAEFENIILRTGTDGSIVKVKDVASVELGAQSYTSFGRLNGAPSTLIGVYQLPGANALDVAQGVKTTMAELAERFPQGVEYLIPYDTTMFVTESIGEVVRTLFEAMALVFLTVFIFLQNWRATLIPLLTIPVSLVGTFAFMAALGFSVNTLTLFGLVLAIGLVVDDAIVLVEATQRYMDEEGMAPGPATKKAMSEVTGPIIATTFVLLAVFIPVTFLGGITGQLYQQFALTIAVSVVLSSFNALTLSPALCALLLRPANIPSGPLGWFYRQFNRLFGRLTDGYERSVKTAVKRLAVSLALFGMLLTATFGLFQAIPTSFVPEEDQGYFFISIQLPDAASLQRTTQVVEQVEAVLRSTPGVKDSLTIGGLSLLTGTFSSNVATIITTLNPWAERPSPLLHVDRLVRQVQARLSEMPRALIVAFNPPAIPGLGNAGGFQFELQDRSAGDLQGLVMAAKEMLTAGSQRPELTRLFTLFRPDVPQFSLELDRTKAKMLGIPLNEIFSSVQTYLGSYYVNDFNKFGRTFKVMTQADPQFRASPESIQRIQVRTQTGEMVPLGTLATISPTLGPETVSRYNLYRTVEINGTAAPSYSSGQAIEAMEDLARTVLPTSMGFEWTNIAYQEKESGGQAPIVFALAMVFVLLVLAAQYESWSVPFAVILSVPIGVFGALSAQMLRGLDLGVYAQIGLVMLIGLTAKNAILIVEFAKLRRAEGMSIREAAVTAARLRLRPIIMTSFAFILGVVPLVVASGAGAASRVSLGTSVFGGMLAATLLAIFFVPVFYVVIQGLSERGLASRPAASASEPEFPRHRISSVTTPQQGEGAHTSSEKGRES